VLCFQQLFSIDKNLGKDTKERRKTL